MPLGRALACVFLVLACLVSGCGLVAGAVPATSLPATSTASSLPPTATPMPELWLLNADEMTAMGGALQTWSESRGWIFVQHDGDLATLTGPEAGAVVGLGADSAQVQQASQRPSVFGVIVGDASATPSGRVSAVGDPGARRDQAGFLAGVIAGLASRYEAVAMVVGTGGEYETIYAASFAQGLRLACGRCRLLSLPPVEVSRDFLFVQGVDVAFAIPGPRAGEALAPIASSDVWVVWVGEPPTGYPVERLAGGVAYHPQALVVPALEALLSGEEGRAWPYSLESGSLVVVDLQVEVLTPGRQRLLDATLEQLISGALDIGLDPATGEVR